MLTRSTGRHWGRRVAGVLLILGIVAGGVTGVMAQQTPAPLPTLEQLRWNEIQQKLGLTDQQVSTLQTLLAANRTTMQGDFQAVRAAAQNLRSAWNQADPTAISTAAKAMQAARDQMFNDRLQGQLNILNALGPDLWKQWKALHKGHRGRPWGRGFGMGM